MKRLLCLLGLHAWELRQWFMQPPVSEERCRDCGRSRWRETR